MSISRFYNYRLNLERDLWGFVYTKNLSTKDLVLVKIALQCVWGCRQDLDFAEEIWAYMEVKYAPGNN